MKRKQLRLDKLTRRQIAQIRRDAEQWLNRPDIRAMREAIRRSTEITADDLQIIVR
jgi:hypothetical protein